MAVVGLWNYNTLAGFDSLPWTLCELKHGRCPGPITTMTRCGYMAQAIAKTDKLRFLFAKLLGETFHSSGVLCTT